MKTRIRSCAACDLKGDLEKFIDLGQGVLICEECKLDPNRGKKRVTISYSEQAEAEDIALSKGVDQFWEEYRRWRFAGLSHYEARNKAIDWWRKYGRREVLNPSISEDGEEILDEEFLGADTRITPEEETSFNLMILKALKEIPSKRAREYLVLLCRAHGLDSFFNEEVHELAHSITNKYPIDEHGLASSKKLHIAVALGYKPKANRSDTNLWFINDKLREYFRKLLR